MKLRARIFAAIVFVFVGVGWSSAQTKNPPNKPAAVTGSGTTNAIPLWTGSSTIGNSVLTQSGSNVSVGGSITATSLTGDGTEVTNVNAAKLGGLLPTEFAQSGGTPTFLHLSLTDFLALPSTSSSTAGVIMLGSSPFLHNYGTTSTSYNAFVGTNAGNFTMTGVDNTAAGGNALRSNTTGSSNTAIGEYALYKNTDGWGNTAVGVSALWFNTTGFVNTALGAAALQANTTGRANVAVGHGALLSNTTGVVNAALGEEALEANTTGHNNTAIGPQALFHNLTGAFNVAVGDSAGYSLTTGSYNIYIGTSAGYADESNTMRIGDLGQQTSTFISGIYGTTTGLVGSQVFVDSAGQLGTISSSQRFKYDIKAMGDASSELLNLRPVTFRYKQAQTDGSHPLQYGLIAEEVAAVDPGLVQFDKSGEPQSVLYHVLPAMLLNEVQKQHAQIETLMQENAELRQQLQSVLLQVKQIRNQVEATN